MTSPAASNAETVLILGATSAVAEHYGRLQAQRGAHLVLAARNGGRLEAIAADLRARGAGRVATLEIDLAQPADGVSASWTALLERAAGRIDIALLAYGLLGDQKLLQTDPTLVRELLDVDMVSACAWMTLAAGQMERQGAGTLIAISSVAGDRGRRTNYVYGAAKAGLSVFMEGLAHRFAGTPIGVLTVKAGFIDTPMTAGFLKGGPLWATPQRVAGDIDRAARRGRTVVYTPWFWWAIMLIIRNMPRILFYRLNI
jgi:short-subunit dehydrogenase